MKKNILRLMSFLLVLLFIVKSFSLAIVSASTMTLDNFDLQVYQAGLYANISTVCGKTVNNMLGSVLPSQAMVDALDNKSKFQKTVKAWEIAHYATSPSKIADGAIDEKGYYEAIILSVFAAEQNNKEYVSDIGKKVTGDVNKIFSTMKTWLKSCDDITVKEISPYQNLSSLSENDRFQIYRFLKGEFEDRHPLVGNADSRGMNTVSINSSNSENYNVVLRSALSCVGEKAKVEFSGNSDGTNVTVGMKGSDFILENCPNVSILVNDKPFKNADSAILVKNINLKTSDTLKNEETLQLVAVVTPSNASNKTLAWTSDNINVATVDNNGLVTAVSAGQATITVTSTDGSNISVSCVITVEKSPIDYTPEGDSNGNNGNSSGGSSSGGNGNSSGEDSSGGNDSPSVGDSNGNNDNPSSGSNSSETAPDDHLQMSLLYYIVEFDANGGTKLSRKIMTLLNDDNLGILPKVQRKNFIFNGWYTQKSGGTKVNSSTVLNAGTTLFAQWTKVDKPSKVKDPSLKSKKVGQLTVSFKKITGAKGYEIAYSINKKFSASSTKKTVSVSSKKTLKKLKSGKKYYARIRAYKVDSTGKKVYGAYSKARSIKVK